MATEKTSNDYREERKARLAKAAKKNSKKSHKVSLSKKAKTAIAAAVAIVIVAAIALAACENSGVFERMKKIETVSGSSYSAVEYEYHYRYIHNYIYSTAQQYDSNYGAGFGLQSTGYDYTKLPEDQIYNGTDYTLKDGSKATWKQYFEFLALNRMQQLEIMVDLSEKDTEFKLDPAALEDANAQITEMKEQLKADAAAQGGTAISFSKYLKLAYGDGMNSTLFEEIVKKQTISAEYSQYLLEKKSDEYINNDAILEENYNADKLFFDQVDYRIFTITPVSEKLANDASQEEKDAATAQAKEEAKKKAEKMLAGIKDEESFIKLAEQNATEEQKEVSDYSKSETTLRTHVQNADNGTGTPMNMDGLDKTAIDWLYGKDTKAGDKKVFDINGTQYVVYVVKPAYCDTAVPADVRHILVQFDEEAKDVEADKAAKKKEAETLLASINAADDKLAKFLEVCESDSDDTASVPDGGLIEFLTRGQYVKAFESWSLDPARKAGDIDIIETEYGYHIMYFVKKYDYPIWKYTISDTLANEELNTMLDDTLLTDEYKVADDNPVVAKLNEKIYESFLVDFYPGVESASSQPAA